MLHGTGICILTLTFTMFCFPNVGKYSIPGASLGVVLSSGHPTLTRDDLIMGIFRHPQDDDPPL